MDLPILIVFILVIFSQWVLIVILARARIPNNLSRTLTEPQSLNILQRAYKKAQAILGQAELTSIKMHAQTELEVKKIADKLTAKAEKKIEEYTDVLTAESREQTKTFLDNFQKEAAVTTVKALEDYKLARMKALDDSISAVVQKTVETVLSRTLTAKEQATLIYEALEQAKKEKLIV